MFGPGFIYVCFRVLMTTVQQQGKLENSDVMATCSLSGWMAPAPTAIPRSSSSWETRSVSTGITIAMLWESIDYA